MKVKDLIDVLKTYDMDIGVYIRTHTDEYNLPCLESIEYDIVRVNDDEEDEKGIIFIPQDIL